MKLLKFRHYVVFISLLAVLAIPARAAYGAKTGFKPGFSLRLYGGLNYLKGGDLNTGLKGFADSAIYEFANSGYSHSGDYQDMNWGAEAGGELVYQFSRYLGLGVGVGYSQASKSSAVTLMGSDTVKFIFNPKASAIPIKVELIFFLPLSDAFRISLSAGPEYYLASVRADIRREYPASWSEWNQEADGQTVGFQGGIALEIRLSRRISLLIEGKGRYAKIKEFKGTNIFSTSSGYQEKQEGTLYYWTDNYTFKPFPVIFVESSFPSEPWQQDVRKAEVDFSGGSIRGGIVFRF
ncbi:MAG: outer membrane beta-barrel protein [Candidatus Aminicenantes bacterium]|nr:outer membrane beta-barrel protein [Candidatus Aminicenantes bacterium]